jgi:hypothetical protein
MTGASLATSGQRALSSLRISQRIHILDIRRLTPLRHCPLGCGPKQQKKLGRWFSVGPW